MPERMRIKSVGWITIINMMVAGLFFSFLILNVVPSMAKNVRNLLVPACPDEREKALFPSGAYPKTILWGLTIITFLHQSDTKIFTKTFIAGDKNG